MAKAPQTQFKPLLIPTEWHERYTDKDKSDVGQIVQWANDNQHQQVWIARLSRVNGTTFHQVINGKYNASPRKFINQVLDAIATQSSRDDIKQIPFVKTSVAQLANSVCKRARTYSAFGILPGAVGTGKSRALQEYAEANRNTILVEADPSMTATALLDEVIAEGGITSPRAGNKQAKFRAVIAALKGTDTLLILDEADTVTPQALHYIRRIRDKAQVGIVLAGTQELQSIIAPVGGEFDQIRSRVNFWPRTVRSITRLDADAIITSAFEDQGELADDIFNALWSYCCGSMRLLVEALIPAIRDYGLKNHPLSVELIKKVAEEVLNLHPVKA